ncbi:MAG: HD domain-containing protein [Peptococcaceae bacterium]|nr:HD domain-containing protein [Peptococcaceae bacterium]
MEGYNQSPQGNGDLALLKTVVDLMKSTFGDDRRRVDHALNVLKYASALCEAEFQGNRQLKEVVELAAVLHDIGIKQAEMKYNSTAPAYQHREGPPIARIILKKAGAKEEVADRVCYIIGHHHLKSKIDGEDFQAVWEADLLVNLPDLAIFKSSYDRYKKMVQNNFRTNTGKSLALGLYNRE